MHTAESLGGERIELQVYLTNYERIDRGIKQEETILGKKVQKFGGAVSPVVINEWMAKFLDELFGDNIHSGVLSKVLLFVTNEVISRCRFIGAYIYVLCFSQRVSETLHFSKKFSVRI